jgi:hypothetical protein
MKSTRIIAAFIVAAIVPLAVSGVWADHMTAVKVDIGRNIKQTAKRSGAPRYGKESHWGLEIYELVDLKPEVTVIFNRPGYEINATPLFSLTMYADSESNNDMAVEKIDLQYRYKAGSHDDARAFISEILAQFKRRKWRRLIHDTCPAVSGRSAYLDETGKIGGSCSLHPDYQPPMDDWLILMRTGRDYIWLGDNVEARLTVNFDADASGLTYNISLEFNDFAIQDRRIAAEQARELAEGDEKGWKSTENYKKNMAANKIKVKLLEENAVRRGDRLISRD